MEENTEEFGSAPVGTRLGTLNGYIDDAGVFGDGGIGVNVGDEMYDFVGDSDKEDENNNGVDVCEITLRNGSVDGDTKGDSLLKNDGGDGVGSGCDKSVGIESDKRLGWFIGMCMGVFIPVWVPLNSLQ